MDDVLMILLVRVSREDVDRLLQFQYQKLKPEHEIIFFPLDPEGYEAYYNCFMESFKRKRQTLQVINGMVKI